MLMVLFIVIFGVTGCDANKKESGDANQKIAKASLNEEGDIVIKEEDITNDATFLSYEIDEVTIGFIVVRGTDGKLRVAFNTCQSCTPSPNAYFVQKGEYFECQNCKNKFHVDKIGIEQGGCNPAPVEEMTQGDGVITISAKYANTYRDNFKNWNGPKA